MRLILKIFIFSMLLLAQPVFAVASNIGILDIDKLLKNTPQAKIADAKLLKQFSVAGKEILQLQRQLTSDIKFFNNHSASMKKAELDLWQEKINSEQGKLQQRQQKFRQEYAAARSMVTHNLITHFQKIVIAIATAKHLDLVLFKDTLYFAGKAIDITDAVIVLSKKNNMLVQK